jgi:nitrogen-specific signal transduction histidine kinase/CheY-like chemotaxis protein
MTSTATVATSPTEFAASILAQMEPLSEKVVSLVGDPSDAVLIRAAIGDVTSISATISKYLAGCGSYTAPSICILSHEVRNALTAVLGTLELLLRVPDKTRAPACLKALQHAVALLQGDEECVNFSLAHLLEQAVTFFKPSAAKKGVSLLLVSEPHLPECFSRPVQILQVIYNLIGNAIKFTPFEGAIVVAASRIENDQIMISVADTGCGISEELSKRLFQPFVQAPETASLGCGLGLSISFNLMQLLGGSIAVSSVLGAGTDFRARLPIRTGLFPIEVSAPKLAKGENMCTEQQTNRRSAVLLIDDDALIRMVLCETIQGLGLDCDEAANYDEACELALKRPFEMIIVDGLYGRGVCLVDELRRISDAQQYSTKIIGFSGDDGLEKARVDGHLAKPSGVPELIAMLKQFGVLTVAG